MIEATAMSDFIATGNPGMTDTKTDMVEWEVLKLIPNDRMPKEGKLRAWPWGTTFAHVVNIGPVCKNADLLEWENQGIIKRVVRD